MAEIESDRKRGHMQRVLRKRDGSARDAELQNDDDDDDDDDDDEMGRDGKRET